MVDDVKSKTKLLASAVLTVSTSLVSMRLAEGFCPAPSIIRNYNPVGTTAVTPRCRRRHWLAMSSKPQVEDDSSSSIDDDNAILHQQIKQADPDWYQEYVADLLGEDYCTNRWPKMDVSALVSPELETAEDSSATRAIESSDAQESLSRGSATTEVADEETNETDIEIDEKVKSEANETKDVVLGSDDVDEVTTETQGDDSNDKANSEEPQETRALIYRSITGKAMTCIPLADLLALGYTVSDLERIQAEFLSIVVLDQRQCPSMGVPSLWKIKDPKAKPEITILDSMEEALALAKQINEEERQERESVQQRRQRQRTRRSAAPESDDEQEEKNQRRTRRREGDAPRRPRRESPERRPERRGEETRRRRRGREEEPAPVGDRRRPRRDRLDRDGTPRKIYRVPRDDTWRAKPRDDPPDPESPLWVNMDTFRDLLQKEADFRMNFIGDDWSEVIAQENDWRTDLYKGWLWSLNNGVGESIVPPSRYERARRNNNLAQQRQSPPPEARPKRRRSLERRRRRPPPGDEIPRSRRESRPPRGDEEQQPRRPRRPSRGAEAPEDDSAAERRSRRRAERRRAPPGNDR